MNFDFEFKLFFLFSIILLLSIILLFIFKKNKIIKKISYTLITASTLLILCLLLLVIIPVRGSNIKRGSVKKIAEIKQVQTALNAYKNDHGEFPEKLGNLIPKYTPALPISLVSSNVNPKMKIVYVSYSGKKKNSTIMQVFGYHFATSIDVWNPVLVDDADCYGASPMETDASLSNPCVFVPENIDQNTVEVRDMNGVITQDFQGRGTDESASSTCSDIKVCIYDVSSLLK